jgi:hypothetical protein
MGIRTKLAALTVAGGAASLVLASTPALASAHAVASGPEIITGQLHGRAALASSPRMPVRFRGVISTRGVVSLGGSSHRHNHVIPTLAGRYALRLTSMHQTDSVSRRTCRVVYQETDRYVVRGGASTGVFAGASGHGMVHIMFTFTTSRYTSGPHRGQCNLSNSAKPVHPRTARATFTAVSMLTTR